MHGALQLLLAGLLALQLAAAAADSESGEGARRWKRNDEPETTSPEPESTPGDGLPPEDLPTGPSLGQILGLVALVITILYIIGISWKVMKIFKGEYVPTEPVYLKYK